MITDGEKGLQIKRYRPQRLRPAPARHELQITVHQPLAQSTTDCMWICEQSYLSRPKWCHCRRCRLADCRASCMQAAGQGTRSVRGCYSRTVSPLAVARSLPSELNVTSIAPVAPKDACTSPPTRSPVAGFHSRTRRRLRAAQPGRYRSRNPDSRSAARTWVLRSPSRCAA